jgi:hypothetical protein
MAYFEGFWSGDVFTLSLRQGLACITLVLLYEVRNYLFDALVAFPKTREQLVNLLAFCLRKFSVIPASYVAEVTPYRLELCHPG